VLRKSRLHHSNNYSMLALALCAYLIRSLLLKVTKFNEIGHVADLGDTNFRICSSGNCVAGGHFVHQYCTGRSN